MVISLSVGEKVHIGDSVTLAVLAIDGDLIRLGVESREPGGQGPGARIEGGAESDLNGWDLN
jgi:hypothetical protein